METTGSSETLCQASKYQGGKNEMDLKLLKGQQHFLLTVVGVALY